ncbi:hypothetical protein KUH03_41045 [Sphingobacterium sp. E70]|uniref:hypothetical protein n=1 Tax=Sphingobacterium sp. E70 TaxID=2853439 RepID=UPI00211C4947|nr:hypothetical protein [Sphingobacterium sp. E70]ULT25156.1 hypothetical protein KUH03_41045 [Sphingobacterium sp. E70]
MIEEGDVNSMVYVNNSNFLIDGKYLLGKSAGPDQRLCKCLCRWHQPLPQPAVSI